MRARVLALLTALCVLPIPLMGAEAHRVVSISSVHPVAHFRPAIPDTQGIIRVYFNAAPFGSLNCRTDAADISLEDWHIYSTIMSGWRDGKTITLYVDDTAHLVTGDVTCRIVAARSQ